MKIIGVSISIGIFFFICIQVNFFLIEFIVICYVEKMRGSVSYELIELRYEGEREKKRERKRVSV